MHIGGDSRGVPANAAACVGVSSGYVSNVLRLILKILLFNYYFSFILAYKDFLFIELIILKINLTDSLLN